MYEAAVDLHERFFRLTLMNKGLPQKDEFFHHKFKNVSDQKWHTSKNSKQLEETE